MTADDTMSDTAADDDDAQANADFGGGFAGVETKGTKPPPANGKAESVQATQAAAEPEPEVVQITAKEWAEIKAAAAKTASYDKQLAQAFGTIGNMQKTINALQPKEAGETPRKVEISKAAFAEMEKDFPELAQQTRAALEAALSGYPIGGLDASKIEAMLTSYTNKREIEVLADAYPEWRTIVGAVDVSREQPDPNNPFRKWLSGKDAAYQDRVNGSESAAVIGRAISRFQRETAPPKQNVATPRDTARAARIAAAVQPRGDNAGGGSSRTTDEDEFTAGFNSR